jgi:ectoine hydroxylase-related dioxygenase (phytanoyl-CoA dioxygenase family)
LLDHSAFRHSTDERERLRLDGYIIVNNLLSPDELAKAREQFFRHMPSWEEYSRAPAKFPAVATSTTNSSGMHVPFPFLDCDVLNNIFFHPHLLGLIEDAIGTDKISLEHSAITGKYAGLRDYDQELHVDYGNHTLAYPKDDAKHPLCYDFGCMIYYSDVTLDLGPTYVVPQTATASEVLEPRRRSREAYGWMYEHEIAATVPAGSALLYSIRTFHRGSAIRAEEGGRFSQHLGFRAAPDPYFDPRHFQQWGGSKQMDNFLIQATPKQRAMIGFPPVGDPYWDDETLHGVQLRYPQMDMSPYRR